MSERLEVLRLGYRRGRDPRITTHLALVARAMGADGFLLAGDEDQEMFDNLNSVSDRFGGSLDTEHVKGLSYLRKHVEGGGVAVHLTMYGEPFRKAIPKIRRDKPVVVVVGGASSCGLGGCQIDQVVNPLQAVNPLRRCKQTSQRLRHRLP